MNYCLICLIALTATGKILNAQSSDKKCEQNRACIKSNLDSIKIYNAEIQRMIISIKQTQEATNRKSSKPKVSKNIQTF